MEYDIPRCEVCGTPLIKIGDSWVCIVCEPFDEV